MEYINDKKAGCKDFDKFQADLVGLDGKEKPDYAKIEEEEVKDDNTDNEPFEEFGVKISAATEPISQSG